jgi:hypothetical protein
MPPHTDDLLSQSDEGLFTKGGCHVFAVCLAETFGYPLRLLRDTSAPEPGGIVHVYCLPAADVMMDFTGPGSERTYRRKSCYDFPPYHAETVTRRRIQELSVGKFGSGGLYAEARFVEVARSRASAAIAAGRSKYVYPS